MTISYGIGKYILIIGLALGGYGTYGLMNSDSASSDIVPFFAITFGVFFTIAGLLFIFIARGRKATFSKPDISDRDAK